MMMATRVMSVMNASAAAMASFSDAALGVTERGGHLGLRVRDLEARQRAHPADQLTGKGEGALAPGSRRGWGW